MARPGIMLYFDMIGPIRVLPDADKGRLLVAMLEYGKDGTAPEFDGMLALAWEFVKPKIDRDEAEYNLSVQRRQYATVCRERKKKGEPEITFDEWVKSNYIKSNQSASLMTNDNQWYPTTTTSTTTPTTTITSTTTTTAAAVTTSTNADGENGGDGLDIDDGDKLKQIGGDLGKGVVFLSDNQTGDLLDRMDVDAFDYYVDKLANFIIRNDAKVKNHYETILKWWREDGATRR